MASDPELTCEVVEMRISAYIDDELPPAEASAVAAHLRLCAACQAREAEERAVIAALRARGKPPVPPAVRRRILDALVEEDRREVRER